eukprot:Platyproteum_vivax@DN589_c0_g1_i3.p1
MGSRISAPALGVLMSLAAGLATTVGAVLILFIKEFRMLWLSAGLAISGGVMMAVTYLEIWKKAVEQWQEAGWKLGPSMGFSLLLVIAGLIIAFAFDVLVGKCFKFTEPEIELDEIEKETGVIVIKQVSGQVIAEEEIYACLDHERLPDITSPNHLPDTGVGAVEEKTDMPVDANLEITKSIGNQSDKETEASKNDYEELKRPMTKKERLPMCRLGMFNAIALAFHNFPEGIVTFVSTVADPRFGIIMAIAIGLHNMPEGLAVALPIYYSTGSKWQGIAWATLSGIAEPIGALLAWGALQSVFGPPVYASMFGICSGMMLYIVIMNLVPSALKYDPNNAVTGYCVCAGNLVMILSLVLIEVANGT